MLYTRSSFLKWLTEHCDCTITPFRDKDVLKIEHGPAKSHMILDGKDRIDYNEIYMHYQKLYLPELPGEKDLVRIE